MKKKILPFLLSIFLLASMLTIFIVEDAKADTITSNILLTNWDDIDVGTTEGTSMNVYFKRLGSVFEISNEYAYSGANLLKIVVPRTYSTIGYINFTTNQTNIQKIALCFAHINLQNYANKRYFYLDILNETGTAIVKLEILYSYPSHKFYFYNYSSGSYEELYSTSSSKQVWWNISFITGAKVRYTLTDISTGTVYANKVGYIAVNTNFSKQKYARMIFRGKKDNVNDDNFKVYLDDIVFAKNVQVTDSIPDFPAWLHYGNVDIYQAMYMKEDTITTTRDIRMTCIIKRVELAFMEGSNAKNNITCRLSDTKAHYDLGTGKYLKCRGTWSDIDLIYWDNLNIYINNSPVQLNFKSTATKEGYYFYRVGTFNSDIDLDGDMQMAVIDSKKGTYELKSYDLAIRVFYILQNIQLEDSIIAQKDMIEQYDTMAISYTANLEETTYLVIENATGNEVYNATLNLVQGKIYFTPTAEMGTGTFTARIKRGNNYYANDSFTVVEPATSNWAVWVSKNSLLANEEFTIYYIAPSGEYGEIDIVKDGKTYLSINIEGTGSTQSYKASLSERGTYTIQLFRIMNGTAYLKDDEKIVIGENYYANEINVNKTKLNEGESVKIYGSHTYAGYNVYVLIYPTGEIIDVSSSNTFSFTYKPSMSSDYTVFLKLNNKTLDKTSFVVAPPGTFYENPLIENFKYIIAVAIILITTILGLVISSRANISTSHKWLVIAIFGMIGMFICIVFKLIPLWVPFLFALILIAYIIREVL